MGYREKSKENYKIFYLKNNRYVKGLNLYDTEITILEKFIAWTHTKFLNG